MFVQRGFNLHSRRHSSGVESSPLDTLHSAKPTASPLPPPPPHARTVSLHWFATRTPTVFLHPNAKRPFTDSSPFLNNFLAWRTSFIDTARNTLLKAVKLPSLRAICQSKTNLDNLDLQSHKI